MQAIISAIAIPFALLHLIFQGMIGGKNLSSARDVASQHGESVFIALPLLILPLDSHRLEREATKFQETAFDPNSSFITTSVASLGVRVLFLLQVIQSAVEFPFVLINALYQGWVCTNSYDKGQLPFYNNTSRLLGNILYSLMPLPNPNPTTPSTRTVSNTIYQK